MKFIFHVNFHEDRSAGMCSYTNIVTVEVEAISLEYIGDFQEHMRQAVAEWFDGATVTDDAMTHEHDRAIFEAQQISTSNAYFDARPHMDSLYNRRIYEDGFHRAWHIKTRGEKQ